MPKTDETTSAAENDADVIRSIRAQTGPVRTVPEAVVTDALQKLDALAANGSPAPKDIAAVIAEALK